MTPDTVIKRVDSDERKLPTLHWQLDLFDKGSYFYYVLSDETKTPVRIIKGHEARALRRILNPRNAGVSDEAVRAYRPLITIAFAGEFDLSEEAESYKNDLFNGQPRNSPTEAPDEVYRRMWTGYLMPNGISAEDVAEKIVKSEPRVRVAMAWGEMYEADLRQKIAGLANVIREYHPSGERGR